jgi:predicted secreted Zn-dependent protease
VAVIAVLTNCWLIAFTNSDFEWLRDEVGEIATVAIVVAWEHSMLLIKYTMTNTISPFPKEIRDEMKRKQHGIEQERYATMRLKKERSRRTNKYRKSLSAEFKRVDDESSSQGGSEISHEHHETNSALYLDKTPDFRRRLTTINSSDEASSSQPGELYEC